jgi:hypothetical protein
MTFLKDQFPFAGQSGRLAPVAFALAALALLGVPQPAKAQDIAEGTVCEAPKDQDTKSACVPAVLECSLVTGYGRSKEEADRLFKGCIRKMVPQFKRATQVSGDAVRRAFSDGSESPATDKAAARRKAQEQAAVAAAQTKREKEQQLASQQRVDVVRQACITGQGTLDVILGPTYVDGRRFGGLDAWAYRGQSVQPVADPDAVAIGTCSVQFTQGNRNVVGRIGLNALGPSGVPPAPAASNGN